MQIYLESVLGREEHAKEVQACSAWRAAAGPLSRHLHDPVPRGSGADHPARRVGLLPGPHRHRGPVPGGYAWIALATVRGVITLGRMTMYLMLFRQGQAAVSAALSSIGGMYEDNLYLSTLYEYLETAVGAARRTAQGAGSQDGMRFEHVVSLIPGGPAGARGHQSAPAARREPRPGGGERLGQDHAHQAADPALPPRPPAGSCWMAWTWSCGRRAACASASASSSRTLPATRCWSAKTSAPAMSALRSTRTRWREAAGKGQADDFIQSLPAGYHTQLGKWFKDGRELSGGQWQKIALSRAFMRIRRRRAGAG